MKREQLLADYIEHLWDKGFKLTDEQVKFIYFARQYADNDALSCIALEATLKTQIEFDGSFFIGLIELLNEHDIKTISQARSVFKQKGIG
ncbi:hypothetical protein SAMN05421734_102388 [Pelagirhabdus alkalitolerans]|uniref:Uncharacterized protein n=1 Tax=Pelagirhabdus alkalitolerans TaxID=1612202 RepID=A0A1G6H9F5_9BACI|nr:DUF6123 family protein [Pelagirhabdus alkalitolerans]SDB90900.1 hypothetical protein SAMN05421734_102388 [Pelagirhabdus alkalitolerans]